MSLSKCCFVLFPLLVIAPYSLFSQNVITIKKPVQPQETPQDSIEQKPIKNPFENYNASGFYYSESYAKSNGEPGMPPIDFTRLIIYIDNYNRVYIFNSTKSIKKLYPKFMKNPNKYAEELGSLEITLNGAVYISTQPRELNISNYKYVGEVISYNQFYLEYKASYYSKKSLNLYMNKY